MTPNYTTSQDYMAALKQKAKVIDTLRKSRRSILMISAKISDYWNDSHCEDSQMQVVQEIEELIEELNNENS